VERAPIHDSEPGTHRLQAFVPSWRPHHVTIHTAELPAPPHCNKTLPWICRNPMGTKHDES